MFMCADAARGRAGRGYYTVQHLRSDDARSRVRISIHDAACCNQASRDHGSVLLYLTCICRSWLQSTFTEHLPLLCR